MDEVRRYYSDLMASSTPLADSWDPNDSPIHCCSNDESNQGSNDPIMTKEGNDDHITDKGDTSYCGEKCGDDQVQPVALDTTSTHIASCTEREEEAVEKQQDPLSPPSADIGSPCRSPMSPPSSAPAEEAEGSEAGGFRGTASCDRSPSGSPSLFAEITLLAPSRQRLPGTPPLTPGTSAAIGAGSPAVALKAPSHQALPLDVDDQCRA